MRGIHAAGIDPHVDCPSTMYKSVASYWKGLKSIGEGFKPYNPCDKTYGHGRGTHNSTCDFDKCFGDFGVINKVKATLKTYAHKEVFALLQKVRRAPPRSSSLADAIRMST